MKKTIAVGIQDFELVRQLDSFYIDKTSFYDIILEPADIRKPAVIIEFKVFDEENQETSLEDTAANALLQIKEKKYETGLLSKGIPAENILEYGIAFQGKKCLVRMG